MLVLSTRQAHTKGSLLLKYLHPSPSTHTRPAAADAVVHMFLGCDTPLAVKICATGRLDRLLACLSGMLATTSCFSDQEDKTASCVV